MGAGNVQVVRKARPALGREGSLEIRVGPAYSSGSCDSWEQYGEKGEAETPLQGAATPALVGMESSALSTFAVGPGDRGAPPQMQCGEGWGKTALPNTSVTVDMLLWNVFPHPCGRACWIAAGFLWDA